MKGKKKNEFKEKIFYIFVVIIMFWFLINPYTYASQTKWDAYPEWGTVLKISFISLWIDMMIGMLLLQI